MLVRWTTSAADDFTHICDYTDEHFGPVQARRTSGNDKLNPIKQQQQSAPNRIHGRRR